MKNKQLFQAFSKAKKYTKALKQNATNIIQQQQFSYTPHSTEEVPLHAFQKKNHAQSTTGFYKSKDFFQKLHGESTMLMRNSKEDGGQHDTISLRYKHNNNVKKYKHEREGHANNDEYALSESNYPSMDLLKKKNVQSSIQQNTLLYHPEMMQHSYEKKSKKKQQNSFKQQSIEEHHQDNTHSHHNSKQNTYAYPKTHMHHIGHTHTYTNLRNDQDSDKFSEMLEFQTNSQFNSNQNKNINKNKTMMMKLTHKFNGHSQSPSKDKHSQQRRQQINVGGKGHLVTGNKIGHQHQDKIGRIDRSSDAMENQKEYSVKNKNKNNQSINQKIDKKSQQQCSHEYNPSILLQKISQLSYIIERYQNALILIKQKYHMLQQKLSQKEYIQQDICKLKEQITNYKVKKQIQLTIQMKNQQYVGVISSQRQRIKNYQDKFAKALTSICQKYANDIAKAIVVERENELLKDLLQIAQNSALAVVKMKAKVNANKQDEDEGVNKKINIERIKIGEINTGKKLINQNIGNKEINQQINNQQEEERKKIQGFFKENKNIAKSVEELKIKWGVV